jgi:hypothetical protein
VALSGYLVAAKCNGADTGQCNGLKETSSDLECPMVHAHRCSQYA